MTASLIGERLAIRAIESEDIDLLLGWINEPETIPTGSPIHPLNRNSLELYVEENRRSIFELGAQYFVVYRKGSRRAIGTIELYDFDPHHRRAAIGILISAKERRKGYAHEALTILCRYAFEDLRLNQVYAEVSEGNAPAQKLFADLSFSLVATLPRWLWYLGDYHSLLFYALTIEAREQHLLDAERRS